MHILVKLRLDHLSLCTGKAPPPTPAASLEDELKALQDKSAELRTALQCYEKKVGLRVICKVLASNSHSFAWDVKYEAY